MGECYFWVLLSSTGVFHVFKIVQMESNCTKHHYLSRLCVEYIWFEEGWGMHLHKI